MGYSMLTDTYDCDFCGVYMKWDESNTLHGEMWRCEKCGKNFCSLCFKTAHGTANYKTMMQDYEYILCPDCFPKYKP